VVRTEGAEAFRSQWAERYADRFPQIAAAARFFTSAAGIPATRL
jgi:hypothetical protein